MIQVKTYPLVIGWLLPLLAVATVAGADSPYDLDEVLKKESFLPKGETYKATVPDTLDLAELANVSLNALIGNMDENQFYGVYQSFGLTKSSPAHRSSLTWNITVKNVRTIPAMRVMSGSDFGVDRELGAFKALMSEIRDDGLLYYPFECQGPPKGTSYPQTNASMMFGMLARQGLDGNPAWDKWIDLLAKGLRDVAVVVEDRAFYPMQAGIDPEGEWHVMNYEGEPPYGRDERPFTYDPLKEPEMDAMGYEGAAKAEANRAMAALSKHYRRTGNEESLEMAKRIYRFAMKPGMWSSNSDEKRYPGFEHGIWMGHFHNGTQALLALLELADSTNDDWLKEFCREYYENTRRNGIVRMGWFPAWSAPEANGDRPSNLGDVTEPCALADFIVDAVKMSDAGLGDYWDDVDYMVRNNLIEQQAVDLEQMRRITGIEPGSEKDALLKRFRGGFMGCAPTHATLGNTAGCCTVNGPQGYYYAWHGITRFDQGVASVNLFLNRASPWMDIDSYLPYEGKVVLHNKQAHTALVRIPSWVDATKVQFNLERAGIVEKLEPARTGNRALIDNLKPGDRIVVEFPVDERTDRYTIAGKEYKMEFKGSTIVDISPRDEDDPDKEYIIFQRDYMNRKETPMRETTRFVSENLVPLEIF